MFIIRDETRKMFVRIADRADPDQTVKNSVIWVCTVGLGLFGRQLHM